MPGPFWGKILVVCFYHTTCRDWVLNCNRGGGGPKIWYNIMIYYPYTYKKLIRFGAVPYQRKRLELATTSKDRFQYVYQCIFCCFLSFSSCLIVESIWDWGNDIVRGDGSLSTFLLLWPVDASRTGLSNLDWSTFPGSCGDSKCKTTSLKVVSTISDLLVLYLHCMVPSGLRRNICSKRYWIFCRQEHRSGLKKKITAFTWCYIKRVTNQTHLWKPVWKIKTETGEINEFAFSSACVKNAGCRSLFWSKIESGTEDVGLALPMHLHFKF